MSRYSRNAASMSRASATTSPPPSAVATLVSVGGSGGTSNSCAMPCRPSTSTSRTRLPPAARASARAAATVDLPVPPLPDTKCSRALSALAGHSKAGVFPGAATPRAYISLRRTGGRAVRVAPNSLATGHRADDSGHYAQVHERIDNLGVRDRSAADPRDQADPRPVGCGRLGTRERAPRADG
ncbi:exported hypothetical protein [Rhodococcus sp. RD6.2]|nr:exported hypothetical protein [Rhodococcus sp. RD6.2]